MNWREDKTLIVLCGGLLFFTFMVMVVVYTRSEDVQLYALYAGVFGQFSGALFMHLKGGSAPPPGSTTVTSTAQVVKTPADPPQEPKP